VLPLHIATQAVPADLPDFCELANGFLDVTVSMQDLWLQQQANFGLLPERVLQAISLVFQDALQDLQQLICEESLDSHDAHELRRAVAVGVGVLAQVVSIKSAVGGAAPFLTFLNYVHLRTSYLVATSPHMDASEKACSEIRQLVECLDSMCPHAVMWLRVRSPVGSMTTLHSLRVFAF
jgi:hypothetical protein